MVSLVSPVSRMATFVRFTILPRLEKRLTEPWDDDADTATAPHAPPPIVGAARILPPTHRGQPLLAGRIAIMGSGDETWIADATPAGP
jgi:hypothetical protein